MKDPKTIMTVGQLKAALSGIPDDADVDLYTIPRQNYDPALPITVMPCPAIDSDEIIQVDLVQEDPVD